MASAPISPANYEPLHQLPPIAGIGTMAEAARIGLSIDDCVARLKWHHWAFKRLHGIFLRRLIAEPIYELKMGFSLHAHYCCEHAAGWRQRVGEMREPPLGLDVCPDAGLDVFFDEILAAPDTPALLVGIYAHAVPALLAALDRHMEETNRLVDHPSYRLCRFARLEVAEMAEYGARCVERLVSAERRAALTEWETILADLRRGGPSPARFFSAQPPAFDKTPRRDERFPDPYNLSVHAEAFLYDPEMPPEPKPLMMYYKRLREIDVPEMMASIIAETAGKPWDYYVDMTRQLWDEARHAMMGEVGFVREGIDWGRLVKVNHTWALALNTQLAPLERHAVLYFIEQGLMPKTGKRFEWEVALASGDPFSAMIQDYDWADEVLHSRIGRDWYVPEMGDSRKATDFGDRCWAKIVIDWEAYRTRGLTQHRNWWPELYADWCSRRGETPDPAVLAFNTTYQSARADLKEISVSG